MPSQTDFPNNLLPLLGIPSYNKLQLETFQETQAENNITLLAATGSGKTIGYLVPVLQALNDQQKTTQALIIVPVRELAEQVAEVFRKMKTGMKLTTCYGGHSRETEIHNLAEAPTLLIGTPGRLCDHIRTNAIDLSHVKILVMDEFDKSLEMGFEEEMGFIISSLPKQRKNVLVSATDLEVFPGFIRDLDFKKINFLPEGFNAPAQLELAYLQTGDRDKADSLYQLIANTNGLPVIVFCNFREAVERISKFLTEKGIYNSAYHGALEQDKRDTALFKFKSGSVQVLVTTDIASRGFDIKGVETIIHYQLPQTQEIFIHRNGRTARMNASGQSILMIGAGEYLPAYVDHDIQELHMNDKEKLTAITVPDWTCLFIAAGKKEKINKIDIVGFLSQKGQLQKEEIGLIEVKDHHSFATVSRKKASTVVSLVRGEKMKNQKIRIEIAR